MEARLLNAKLWVRDGLKPYHGRPDLVPMTRKLLSAGHSAYRKYEEHLEAERQAEIEKSRREAEAEQLRLQKEAQDAADHAARVALKDLQRRLQESQSAEKEQRKAADQLVEEASKKLDAALKANDLTAAKVAQGMLAGARAMREKAEGMQKECEPLQKRVTKCTSSLLEILFKNHAKRPKTNGNGGEDKSVNPDDPNNIS